jgi:predicted kinase
VIEGVASNDPPAAFVVALPEPSLVVLVGAAGSGKSTLAARLFRADEVLSSDAFRELVAGDAAEQSATRAAFGILHRELARRMALGRTTVVDATNVTAFARRSLLRRAAAHGIPAVAVILALPPTLVLARNATRPGRIVPEGAVKAQLRDLERSLRRRALEDEGFAAIHHVTTPEVLDRLRIERLAGGLSAG